MQTYRGLDFRLAEIFDQVFDDPNYEATDSQKADLASAGKLELFLKYKAAHETVKKLNFVLAKAGPKALEKRGKQKILGWIKAWVFPLTPNAEKKISRIYDRALSNWVSGKEISLNKGERTLLKEFGVLEDFDRFQKDMKRATTEFIYISRARKVGESLGWGVSATLAAATALLNSIEQEWESPEEYLNESTAIAEGEIDTESIEVIYSDDISSPVVIRMGTVAFIYTNIDKEGSPSTIRSVPFVELLKNESFMSSRRLRVLYDVSSKQFSELQDDLIKRRGKIRLEAPPLTGAISQSNQLLKTRLSFGVPRVLDRSFDTTHAYLILSKLSQQEGTKTPRIRRIIEVSEQRDLPEKRNLRALNDGLFTLIRYHILPAASLGSALLLD